MVTDNMALLTSLARRLRAYVHKHYLIMEEKEIKDPEMEVNEQQEETAQAAETVETAEPTSEELLAKAQEEIANLQDKNLRMMAEFDNYRRRTSKEKLELQKSAGERIFKDMLALVDDFERAEQAGAQTDDVNALKEGMSLIHKKFLSFLEQNDVHAIETEDADFNVDLHEAITTFAAGEDKKGKIIDCTQKGYTLGEKVIRYAKVVVGE